MKRVLLAITAGLTVFGLVFGAAATLDVQNDSLAAGSAAPISGCDDAVNVAFGLAAGDVTSVAELTVSGIAAACIGETLAAEVVATTDSVTTTTGGTPVIVGGDTETFVLDALVDAASISQVNVTITGP